MPRSCPVNYPGWQERRALREYLEQRPLVRGDVRLSSWDLRQVDRIRWYYRIRAMAAQTHGGRMKQRPPHSGSCPLNPGNFERLAAADRHLYECICSARYISPHPIPAVDVERARQLAAVRGWAQIRA